MPLFHVAMNLQVVCYYSTELEIIDMLDRKNVVYLQCNHKDVHFTDVMLTSGS